MPFTSVIHLPVSTVNGHAVTYREDALAIEEPLEIRLEHGPDDARIVQNISVTMRTPGNDAELATGFLFTEGIITRLSSIAIAEHSFIPCAENRGNVIKVALTDGEMPNLHNAERNFYTTSSCGVCGKGSINAIRTVSAFSSRDNGIRVDADLLMGLPVKLRDNQKVFADTGGLHASALFNLAGDLLLLREDVGRHNALDKLIGAAITDGMLPLQDHILLLSGRASFELVQKAAMAGVSIIAAVGAPSSLAVQLAQEFNITLAGFLRGSRFNIYTHPKRVLAGTLQHEDTY